MRRTTGFTLIELIVVVAVLGIISSLAFAVYQSYIEDSQSSLVSNNYNAAVKYVESRYVRAESLVAMGVDINTVVPGDAAGWINLLNTNGKRAPTAAGAAYAPGAGDPALGSVGITVAGDYATGDSQVTVTQPAFGHLPETDTIIAQVDF